MEDQTLDMVRRLLANQYGSGVQVELQERLDSPHVVLRCTVSGAELPATVIVKHGHGHFPNELATLQFLDRVAGDQVAPRVYAADVADKLLVMEDFGEQRTLLDVMNTDPEQAEQALVTYGAYLGRFHAASVNREADYSAQYDATNAPACDTSEDVRKHTEALLALFATLQISVPADFHAELDAVGRLMHESGPFWVLAHCDAGPHNVLHLSDRTMLIDFEFGQYACGVMDLVSARMGFPHTMKMGRVPLRVVQQLEDAYLHTFAERVPQAVDQFADYVAAACVHWSFGRLGHYWRGYLKDYLEVGDALHTKFPNYERTRRHQLTYIVSAKNTLAESGCLPTLYRLLEALEERLRAMWPELEPVDLYPAFQNQPG